MTEDVPLSPQPHLYSSQARLFSPSEKPGEWQRTRVSGRRDRPGLLPIAHPESNRPKSSLVRTKPMITNHLFSSSGRSKIGPLLGVRWIPQGRIRACAETRRVPSSSTRPSMLTLCMMNLAEPERTPLPGTVPHIRGCFHSGRSAPQTGGVLRLAERSLSIES